MFPLQHPVVVLGPGQLVHQAVALLPVRVQVVNTRAFEITNLTTERLQFVVNGQHVFPQMSGVCKTFVTLITHFFFYLHVELLYVIFHSIFSFE